jgi:hypothetical protein
MKPWDEVRGFFGIDENDNCKDKSALTRALKIAVACKSAIQGEISLLTSTAGNPSFQRDMTEELFENLYLQPRPYEDESANNMHPVSNFTPIVDDVAYAPPEQGEEYLYYDDQGNEQSICGTYFIRFTPNSP